MMEFSAKVRNGDKVTTASAACPLVAVRMALNAMPDVKTADPARVAVMTYKGGKLLNASSLRLSGFTA
ncbi:hypothetical protein CPT_Maja_075 [Burkholderia phage Maja]|uniref:Uncharacterized protein n=1 Tax=Burkholderia phage Maja TaxID=2767571 RepID=A0A7S6R7A2_9CAUD|nr:hypothetical protein CPT_Maja_075 [Burkholderia phage Maja]